MLDFNINNYKKSSFVTDVTFVWTDPPTVRDVAPILIKIVQQPFHAYYVPST